ncbi:MAG: hypothetical protein AMXMBFR13_31310 [Phycisphaerae bacterium]
MILACTWGGLHHETSAATPLPDVREEQDAVVLATANYRIRILKQGFRFNFLRPDGTVIAPAHAACGLQFAGSEAALTTLISAGEGEPAVFEVNARTGGRAEVRVDAREHWVRFSVRVVDGGSGPIVLRTGWVGPAFGLGDHGGLGRDTTELTGISQEALRAQFPVPGNPMWGVSRLVSNFVICPRAGLAAINIEPGHKVVRITPDEHAQGCAYGESLPAMYYFFGSPERIYRSFLDIRAAEGFPVFEPRYEWFGVGWEAWGALAWETNQQTVTENVNRYLELGYPLRWMVVGSGFWPRHDPALCATTSFGLWDAKLYPDPGGLIDHFHGRGLKFLIGLRIAFITEGPFAADGVARRAFIEESGKPKVFRIGFPRSPCYLLDAHKPEAVAWYVGLCRRWLDAGVDGFKEDLFGYRDYVLADDKIDPVNETLMKQGVYIMGRNGYVGSPMDVHRIEDFNFDQTQDRGPLNCLSLAYSGFACPYPDLVGGTFTIKNMPPPTDSRVRRYFMRNVQFAAVTPVLAMGYGPWNMEDPEVERVALAAARLHDRLQPYIYSAAVDAARTGFPHSFAPLPLAFPDDPAVYELENTMRRGYQWMLGPSLLATPLYGDDYTTAETRDVYLPAGRWMDYDTGEVFVGPATLQDFPLPVGKTPLFVGGKGVLVERGADSRDFVAVVYPTAPEDLCYRFHFPDGRSHATLTGRPPREGRRSLGVRDKTSQRVLRTLGDPKTGALRFPIEPGHAYELMVEAP